PSHGVALLRITGAAHPALVPPSTTLSLTGPAGLIGGQPGAVTETFANNGVEPVTGVRLSLPAPPGWTVTATSPASFRSVTPGAPARAALGVPARARSGLFRRGRLAGAASYGWDLVVRGRVSQALPVTVSPPVQAPYATYSSATDAPAAFAQSGSQFGISG